MRRQSIVKSLTVVAALSACAVAAPTALANTANDTTPYANNAGAHYSKSTPYHNNAGPVSGLGYNVPPPDTSKAVAVKQQPGTPTVVKLGSSGGFHWDDAGIGAGGMLAVVALAGGGLVLVSRRRTTHPRVSPTAG